MKIDRALIKALNLEYIRRSKQTARKLMEDEDLKGAKADLEWVEVASHIIAVAERGKRLRLSVMIAFVCLLIAGLAWTLRIRSTQLSFEVVTRNVSLTLSEDWSSRHQFTPNRVSINNVVKVSAPGLILPRTSDTQEELTTISLEGKKIIVDAISLLSGAKIELSSGDETLNLFVKDSPVSGELFVEKADIVIETEDDSIAISVDSGPEPPETIGFTTAKTGADPVWFELGRGGKNRWLSGFKSREIGFLEENPPASGNFESVILSGTVRLPETGKAENLQIWDSLILKGVQSRRVGFSNAKNGIHVLFEGTVSGILVGPQGFEKNLMPTYLEYIYHQQRLTFFWSVVVFLWGMLWSIRNMIFREGLLGKGWQ